MGVESVEEKCDVKDKPRRQRRTGDGPPRLVENRLQRYLDVTCYLKNSVIPSEVEGPACHGFATKTAGLSTSQSVRFAPLEMTIRI